MQEIARDVFIESKYPGVVVGAIRSAHGQILIDAPLRMEDVRSWRTSLEKISGGDERLLINLDTHLDRTLGVKGMECMVIAHHKSIMMIRSRPQTSKNQEKETCATWESYDGLSSIRWIPPEITFDEKVYLNWGNNEIILEHHFGANAAGVWVSIPTQKVIFVGDSVVNQQPPFLAFADMDEWLNDMKLLLSIRFRDYKIVNGRNGLVTQNDVREMVRMINSIRTPFERLKEKRADCEEVYNLASKILRQFDDQPDSQEIFLNRLKWGLSMYYEQHVLSHKNLNSEKQP